MRALVAAISLMLCVPIQAVECTAFRADIDALHQAGQRSLVWRHALAEADAAGDWTHENHPVVIAYQRHVDDYGRMLARLQDHVTDIIIALDEIHGEAVMAAVAEFESGRRRAQEAEEAAAFPAPDSYRIWLETGVQFMEALFAIACVDNSGA